MPFSIIGSTEDVKTRDGRVVKGREYLWGVAEGKSCSPEKTSLLLVLLLICTDPPSRQRGPL
jgi:septin family protein